MNKDLQNKLYKILVLTDMLIQEFDQPCIIPTKQGKKLINEANSYKEVLITTLDDFYKNDRLFKSDILQTLTNKLDYIIKRELK